MSKSLLFILNPRAGRTRSKEPLLDALTYLSECGYLVSLRQTKKPQDATNIVLAEGGNYDAIVCCGGDGTLNETVTGLMQLQSPPSLGYIPSGSTNDFAASLHLPDQPLEAAKVITASAGKLLDVGQFNQRPFIYVASFGAFTKASYSAPQNIKNDLGHLAYILEGVKDLSTLRLYGATIRADGEVFHDQFLFGAVTNATSVGGVMKLQQDLVVLDDGKFELMLIPLPKSAADLQKLIVSLLYQNYTGSGIIFRHVSQLSVHTEEAFPWALDGEFAPGAKDVEICNLNRRLKFLL